MPARRPEPAAGDGAALRRHDLVAVAPPAWAPRPFGALLWQSLTGLTYLHPASDLGALWPVTPATDLPALLDGLDRIDAAGPVTVDGEVVLPDGAGVQWRELRRALARPGGGVLAKGLDGVSLRPAGTLFLA